MPVRAGAGSGAAAAAAGADRGAGRAQLQAVPLRGRRAPATRRKRCWPAWASTTPRPPPSCAAMPTFRAQVLGRAGRTVTVEASDSHALDKLSARWAPDDDGTFKRLVVERTPQGRFASRVETAPLVAATRMGSGTVRTSLFAAADEARIPDAVVSQIVDIFSGDIDFHRSLHTRRPLQRRLRGAGSRRRAHAHRPRPVGRVRQQGQAAPGHVVRGAGPQGRLLHAGRQEPGHLVPGLADGVLARDQRLRDALPPGPAHAGKRTWASTTAPRPARRCAPSATAWSNSPASRTASATSSIVKHNNTDETLYAHLSRIDVRPGQNVQPGPEHRRRRRHRLGHRPAPALRVPRQRRAPRPDGDRQAQRRGDRCQRAGPARSSTGSPRSMRTQLAAAASAAVVASAD